MGARGEGGLTSRRLNAGYASRVLLTTTYYVGIYSNALSPTILLLLNLERINVDIIPSIEAVPGHWTQYFVQHLERA